jgi:hypothetical protein
MKALENIISVKQKSKQNTVFFQPKLTINPPDDQYEREADSVAEHVMRMPITRNDSLFFSPASISSVQRKCAECEEEEKLQRKENGKGEVEAPGTLESYVESINSGGKALPNDVRSFFEPRFGYDFSNVRIHNDSVAAKSAQGINALAYTSGNNIVFNQNQYSPETDSGKRLLAHELTHVVQQGESLKTKTVQRSVGRRSRCAANIHGSPADPLNEFSAANERAVNMSLGASHLLFSDSLFIQDPSFGPSSTLPLYRSRFGTPTVQGTKFKNRFDNSLHNTMLIAESSEMQFLSNRFQRISNFLSGNIHFICTGTSRTEIGECNHRCGANTVLASCPAGHGNEMAVCSGFWNILSVDLRAIGMIHEVSHMLYGFGDRDTAPYAQTDRQRRREPECYASLVADIYGSTPFDPSCPVIVT